MQADHLADTVEEAFRQIDGYILGKVHERWKMVLKLIIAGKGTNTLVEKSRWLKGKLAVLLTMPNESDDEQVQMDAAAVDCEEEMNF